MTTHVSPSMNVFRLVLLGLAACIVAMLGGRLYALRPSPEALRPPPVIVSHMPLLPPRLPQAPAPAEPQPPKAAEPQPAAPVAEAPAEPQPTANLGIARAFVALRLAEVPEYADFYMELLTNFPHNYSHAVDTYAHLHAEAKPLPSDDAMMWDIFRDLQQSQGLLAAQADDADLRAFFDARLAVLDAMAPLDARQCADFLYGMTDAPFETFAHDHRKLVATFAMSQLAAIKDGRTRHAERTLPTADDFDLLTHGLEARQLSPEEIAVLVDGKSVDPPTPEARLCDMGRIYLEVLRGLPAEAQHRIYRLAAELLARS